MKRAILILSAILILFISSCTQQEEDSFRSIPQEELIEGPLDQPTQIKTGIEESSNPVIEDTECPKFPELKMRYDDGLKYYITDVTKYSYNNREAIKVHNYTIAGALYNDGKYIVYCRSGYTTYGEDIKFFYCDNTENSINLALVKTIQTEKGTKIQSKQAKLLFDRDGSYLGTIC